MLDMCKNKFSNNVGENGTKTKWLCQTIELNITKLGLANTSKKPKQKDGFTLFLKIASPQQIKGVALAILRY